MKVDVCISIAFLLWFCLVYGIWRILVRKLDNEVVLAIESYDEPQNIEVIPYAREKQVRPRPRNRRHGRAKGRMPASA